jgi:hypothetical protein
MDRKGKDIPRLVLFHCDLYGLKLTGLHGQNGIESSSITSGCLATGFAGGT